MFSDHDVHDGVTAADFEQEFTDARATYVDAGEVVSEHSDVF